MTAGDRESTLTAVDGAYAALHGVLTGLDAETGTRARVVGPWSVAQMLAHMVGWLGEATGSFERLARGERPTPEGVDYSNLDAWNAKFVEVHTREDWEQALADFVQRFQGFRSALAVIPAERFGEGRSATTIATIGCINHFPEHQAQSEQSLGAGPD